MVWYTAVALMAMIKAKAMCCSRGFEEQGDPTRCRSLPPHAPAPLPPRHRPVVADDGGNDLRASWSCPDGAHRTGL